MRPFRSLSLLGGLALALAGCGGGGGGSKSPAHFVDYRTEWGTVVNGSQRVTLMRTDGTVVNQQVVNETGAANRVRFTLSGEGSYIVRAELNSAPNFGGTTTGISETTVEDRGTVSTLASGTASRLDILPSSITVDRGVTMQLAASPKTSTGALTFTTPGSYTWSVDNAKATVTSDGKLTGVTDGSFVLTLNSTAVGGSRTVNATVGVPGAVRNKWTVLVFLSSANNLYPFALPNINQMESVANDDLRFVVQWKQAKSIYPASSFDGTRRYLVKPDKTDKLASTLVQDMGSGVDMGSDAALRDFIDWGTRNYPSEHTVVIVWSHGNGWQGDLRVTPTRAVSYDDEFSSAIEVWDLPKAFAGHHFDFVSFDACLMQMLEVGLEIAPYTDYIAASAENTPAAGYPYDRVFGAFATNPDAPVTTLAQSFVTGHVQNPTYQTLFATQSIVDTSKLAAVETAINELGTTLIANNTAMATIFPSIRAGAPKYAFANDGRYFYDLGDMMDRLIASSAPEEVKEKARVAKAANQAAVLYSAGTPLNSWTQGLALDFSPATAFRASSYSNLKLAKDTQWDDWLKVAP